MEEEEASGIWAWFTPDRLITLAMVLVIASTVSVLAVIFLVHPDKQSLGDYDFRQRVLNTVDGQPNTARLGEPIRVQGKRCVNEDIDILKWRTFIRVDTTANEVAGTGARIQEGVPATERCTEDVFPVDQPASLKPGQWRIDGIDISTAGDSAIRYWQSEPFYVVP